MKESNNDFEIYAIPNEKKFRFSIIMSIFNMEDYLEESIDSIINQTLDFKKNTQLILIDDGSNDNSKEICLKYYEKFPNNIVFISKSNEGQGKSRNVGLEYAQGEIVNFLDADDYLSKNTLKEVCKFFREFDNEMDIVSIPLILFGREEGDHRLNYKYKYNRVIDLIDEPNNPQLSASSAFVRFDSIGNLRFSENILSSEDCIFINKILLKKKKLGVINTAQYYYRMRFDESSTIDKSIYEKRYYNERFKYYFSNLIDYCLSKEGSVPDFIQYTLSYDFQWIFKLDSLDIFDNNEEINEFWYYLDYILSFINENVIVNNRNIEDRFKSFFIYLKNKEYSLEYNDSTNELFLKSDDYEIDYLNRHKIYLDHIEIINGILKISAFTVSFFDYDYLNINVITKFNGKLKEYKCKQYKYLDSNRDIVSFLSIPWKYCLNFDIEIPLNKDEFELSFKVIYEENDIKMSYIPIIDLNIFSGLSTSSANFVKDEKIVLFKKGIIHVLNYKYISLLRFEYSNFRKIWHDKKPSYLYALVIRFLFLLLYPIYRKKDIWLFEDRPNIADDNAIQLFKYAISQDDKDIKKYFVIDKNANSYDEIKTISKNIIQYKSFKHKMLFLFSKKNISSYVNTDFINPFDFKDMALYMGLITTENYFLQHGIIKDDVSLHINRYKKNLRLFLTSSDLEKDSIVNGRYNYDESVVKVLGLPRYDNLNFNPDIKKQILFMPTWRMDINNKFSFLKSEYYNDLEFILNNEELYDLLNNFGYELVFKPHPELEKYMDYIQLNANVRLATDERYQDLFNDSSLLITDYSSVFFDFAYLKKPVIYFHSNDYHYDEGYFKYGTMGFGEIIKTNDDLVKKIRFYLSNDCKMEDKYKKRVDEFFKYHDKNNSKRVYEWIKQN